LLFPATIKTGAEFCERHYAVAMLCGVVVLSNCACIWINFSSRLLPNTFVVPEAEESLEELLLDDPDDVVLLVLLGAEVIEMLEPSL
jgi:hypothetical protein